MYFKSQNSYLAAVYLRLSRDDGDKVESDSIRNQRSLLRDFANQHNDITLVKSILTMDIVVQILSVRVFRRCLKMQRNIRLTVSS